MRREERWVSGTEKRDGQWCRDERWSVGRRRDDQCAEKRDGSVGQRREMVSGAETRDGQWGRDEKWSVGERRGDQLAEREMISEQ